MIVGHLYARNAWHPGSSLHHSLASAQATAALLAIALAAVGIRKEGVSGYAVAAIMAAVICLAGATV
jgi:hypothetical protein